MAFGVLESHRLITRKLPGKNPEITRTNLTPKRREAKVHP